MVKTTKIAGGADYASVADRLKEFRQDHPRALIETKPLINDDGSVVFSTRILSDKSNKNSAESTGTAMYSAQEMKKAKSFEKLETISVGRALSLLGYLNSGQVASSEEMSDFKEYKDSQIEQAIDLMNDTETVEELRNVFMSLGSLISESRIIEAKNEKKAKLENADN